MEATGMELVGAAAGFRRALLAWYRRCGRDLPWRRTRDAYAVWLSELMLQQTQVATVIPYYERFLTRFPNVAALAQAPLDEVLRMWAGLGYYARARNLHRAASEIVEEHGGAFPNTAADLAELPGIGRYTAGAIASIAFGRRAAVVDGNVARVVARLAAIREPIKTATTVEQIWKIVEAMLPVRECGDFNQAMMELGATVCTPRGPQCLTCPVREFCAARRLGIVEQLPVMGAARAPKAVEFVVAAVSHEGRWLFRRRPPGGLWGGLWEMPTRECTGGEATWRVAQAEAREAAGGDVRARRRPSGQVRFQLTHRTARFVIHEVVAERSGHESRGVRWLALERIGEIAISAAMQRIVGVVAERAAASRAADPARAG